MHKLMRRVALGLTLPLVVGAPVVLLAQPAAAAELSLTSVVTSPADNSVYGQEVRATATVTTQTIEPISDGVVRFSVRRAFTSDEFEPVGGDVSLDAAGHATSQPLQMDGKPLEISQGSDGWEVRAEFVPDEGSDFDGSADSDIHRVDVADSSVAVLPTATTLVADVTGAFPGGIQASSIKPGGAVEFKVNGAVVGSNDVVDGRATINHVLPAGPQTVTATYTGDSRYTGTADTMVRKDPILLARALSRFPKSKSGWYHSAVRVWFICQPAGSELLEGCPKDVSLKGSGKDQTVTRSVRAIDGGFATVTIGGINIDRGLPEITVKGRTCTATDKLSGVKGKCHMKIARNGNYRAIARDRAGNRAVVRGTLD